LREAFVSELEALALEDNRIVLLTGDLGFKLFDRLAETCLGRFLNCGVAEQNMVGVAAGMALSGLRPVCYSIATFMAYRAFEQIKLDICYHRIPVIVVGVGGGFGYSGLGPTHHSLEDVAVMRSLPGMTVICPSDGWECRAALRSAMKHDGPSYIRLGGRGGQEIRGSYPSGFQIGKAIVLREGRDVCILSCGPIMSEAIAAADIISNYGIQTQIVSMHTIKPLDEAVLREAFMCHHLVVVVEEHSVIGGLSSAVAEWMADAGPQKARLLRLGSPDEFFKEAGERHHALTKLGLTGDKIAARIMLTLAPTA